LQRHPSALDPFCRANWTASAPRDDRFHGALGSEEDLYWENVIELTPQGVISSASPSWLWQKLVREVSVRSSGTGTRVGINISWDAGTVAYEPLLRMHVAHFCRQRLTALAEEFASRSACAAPVIELEPRPACPPG
jgi:hypothetical protein